MSEYRQVLEQVDNARVVLVQEIYPDAPYNDGGSPLVRIDPSPYSYGRVEQVTEITSYRVDDSILYAAARFAFEPDLFERYMRIFHGTTSMVWHDGRRHGGDYVYVTFDTADWREAMGLTNEWMADHAEGLADHELADMDEWIAYLEGDVWGYVIERRTTWVNQETGASRVEWEEDDSCWGFYGREYAEQSARDALAYYVQAVAS